MSPRICHRDYKRHLEKCFQYISNNPDICANCFHLSGHARSVYSKLRGFAGAANWSFSIDPPWMIPLKQDADFRHHEAYLLVSGLTEVEDSNFSRYSFAVSIVTDDRIARRFHFDVATEIGRLPKPISHMQYGGDSHEARSYTYLSYPLDPSIKKPRFPFPPIDFVLLFDLLLRQYNTSIGRKYVEEPQWRKFVKNSERFRLERYYRQIHRYIVNLNREKTTLFEKLCH